MSGSVYEIRNLTYGYVPGNPVINRVTLDIRGGEFCAVIGPNGSGKSTLLRLMTGLIKPQSGVINLKGRPLGSTGEREIARSVSYLPQEDEVHFPFTAGEVVLLGRWPHSGGAFFDSSEDHDAALRAMERVGITDWSGRLVTELSGGERARVLLAKAVATEPECMLLDEPASELDLKYRADAYGLLRDIANEGIAVVVVAHDIGSVARWADRFVLISDGRVLADGNSGAVLDRAILEQAYGVEVKVISDGMDRAVFPAGNGRLKGESQR